MNPVVNGNDIELDDLHSTYPLLVSIYDPVMISFIFV